MHVNREKQERCQRFFSPQKYKGVRAGSVSRALEPLSLLGCPVQVFLCEPLSVCSTWHRYKSGLFPGQQSSMELKPAGPQF